MCVFVFLKSGFFSLNNGFQLYLIFWKGHGFVFLPRCMVSYCVYVPQFLSPFICTWIATLTWFHGYPRQCSYKHGCAGSSVVCWLRVLQGQLNGLPGSLINLLRKFILVSEGSTPTSNTKHGSSFLHFLLLLSASLMGDILTLFRWDIALLG